LTTFEDLGLNEAVLRGVNHEGFTTPTPIQSALIPAVMEGRDCVGLSQTGSGKTAAFVLPILHKIAEEEQSAGSGHCRALIVAPTRELAMQIVDNARALSKFSKANVALLIGGTSYTTQIRAMKRGADLVIATPGRLIDHIESGYLALHRTHTIVLDEADQMMDMGFMPAIRKIMEFMPEKRQTILLSATMPKPIRKLANDFLRKPFETEVSPQSKPVERIEQHVYSIKARDRRRSLLALVAQDGVERGIIFTRTKRTADDVEMLLRKAGIQTFALHGDKTKGERNRALTSFKKGQIPLLVATDIAARGIDVDGVSHVINYEMPNVPEAYVHRVGRTARAGKDGVAFSLVAPAEQKLLREVERLTGLKLKMEQLNIRDVEMPAKDAVAVEPPEDERRRAGRAGQKPGAKAAGPRKDGKKFSERQSDDRRTERGERKPGKRAQGAKRQENAARPPKRDPNAPVWNPIRARVDTVEDEDRERFAREETVRPKKKGSGRKQPKPGNHRKGQNRPAHASGKNKGQRRGAVPANNARSDRASSSKAKRPSEAAA
jgi:ATP-dependent RNA helicase RhlE